MLLYVTCVQSIDRLRLGKMLHNCLARDNKNLDFLVPINTSYEESKFGVLPENTLGLIEQLGEFDTLQIKGIMTIGELSSHSEETRKIRLLKSIQEQVIEQGYLRSGDKMDVLSMGMSGDLEVSIE